MSNLEERRQELNVAIKRSTNEWWRPELDTRTGEVHATFAFDSKRTAHVFGHENGMWESGVTDGSAEIDGYKTADNAEEAIKGAEATMRRMVAEDYRRAAGR